MSLVLAIVALGLLIIVHEAGHYFVARACKMKVERFSLGFGPALLKWRRGDTQFQLAPLPFGGFVQIVGMNPAEQYEEDDPHVYPNRPTYQRFLTIFAGPFTNLVSASILIFIVFLGAGVADDTGKLQVSGVVENEPAAGKLQPGDVILEVNGVPVGLTGASLRDRLQETKDQPVALKVRRGDREEVVQVTPRLVEERGYAIGVALKPEQFRRDMGVGESAVAALEYPVVKSGQILAVLWLVVTREIPADFAGPVKITQVIQTQIKEGWVIALEFLAVLNVYLGLFNLLPVPALDGGRLVFLSYELATRRRPNPRIEAAVHTAGFLVLFLVLILVTFNDIKGLFT